MYKNSDSGTKRAPLRGDGRATLSIVATNSVSLIWGRQLKRELQMWNHCKSWSLFSRSLFPTNWTLGLAMPMSIPTWLRQKVLLIICWFTELHKIGWSGSHRWKAVRVPWAMLFEKPPNGNWLGMMRSVADGPVGAEGGWNHQPFDCEPARCYHKSTWFQHEVNCQGWECKIMQLRRTKPTCANIVAPNIGRRSCPEAGGLWVASNRPRTRQLFNHQVAIKHVVHLHAIFHKKTAKYSEKQYISVRFSLLKITNLEIPQNIEYKW